jgi:CheY-like chemotaxis protein/class 3 adenylate cyclase
MGMLSFETPVTKAQQSQMAVVVFARMDGFAPSSDYRQSVFRHALQYVLEKFGAIIFERSSDNHILAAFNLPDPVPVPAYLATTSTLEMVQVFNALRREMKLADARLSIGISKSQASLAEGLESRRYRISGPAVDIACYLAGEAAADEVAVSAEVYEEMGLLASNFKVIDQHEVFMPGIDTVQQVYRLSSIPQTSTQTRTLSSVVPAVQPAGSQVLIAEDDPALRSLFGKVLKNAGFNLQIAIDGHAAMQQLANGLPDVLVVDFGLPGVSGQEIIRAVRQHENEKHVYIIVVTGNHLASQSAEAELVDLLLIKPISPRDLVSLIKRFVH